MPERRPRSPKVIPKAPHVIPKSPQQRPKSSQRRPRSPQVTPKALHVIPKPPQVVSKAFQVSPSHLKSAAAHFKDDPSHDKAAPSLPNSTLGHPQGLQRCCESSQRHRLRNKGFRSAASITVYTASFSSRAVWPALNSPRPSTHHGPLVPQRRAAVVRSTLNIHRL